MNDEEKQKNYELADKLISEQNFAAAVIVGALATLLAAAAYGIIVATWAYSYGFVAAGVGVVIGLSEWSISDVSFVDLVYWFVAVFCAVFLAKRPLSRSDKLAIGLFDLRG